MDLKSIKNALREYDGPAMRIMEICGSHTEAISKHGIPSMLSDKITLLSGPGCPVCVTQSAYIDKLISLAGEGKVIATFGDLIRVPGSSKSLNDIKGEGARVEMVYSPLDTLELARNDPDSEYVFAAVGFETTTPAYALLMEELVGNDIDNIKLLTALKTMPEVIDSILCAGEDETDDVSIDGFIAPGHVSVVTGYEIFEPIAERYSIPFGVAGFSGEELLLALYGIVSERGRGVVKNYYPSVVTREGNTHAKELVGTYFEKCDAAWRGMGIVKDSGLRLKSEYSRYDAGSMGLDTDEKKNNACCCDRVLMGKIRPYECPLFGKLCVPLNPQGACMVSTEGSCFNYYVNKRRD